MRRKLDNELICNTALGFFSRYGYKKSTDFSVDFYIDTGVNE